MKIESILSQANAEAHEIAKPKLPNYVEKTDDFIKTKLGLL